MDLFSQKAAAVKAAQDIIALAKSGNRDLTADEMTTIEAKKAEITDLSSKIELAAKSAALMSELGDLGAAAEDAAPKAKSSKRAARTMGEHFIKSARLSGVSSKNTNEFGDVPEFKAAGDLTVTTGLEEEEYDHDVVGTVRTTPTVASLMASGTLTGDKLVYTVQTVREGDLGAVAEGGQKPKVRYNFIRKSDEISKIAGLTDISDEMIADKAYVVSEIDTSLAEDLDLEEENQLLNGDGVYPNVEGLLVRSGVLTEASANVEDNSKAIFRATTKIHMASKRKADAVIIHPLDYQRERLVQDANGQYIASGPFSGQYGQGGLLYDPSLWGLRTIVTDAIDQGTVLVGAFATAKVIRKGGTQFARSAENKDNFEKNVVTIRAEKRVGLQVKRPGAFCKVTLSSAPAV